MLEDSDPGDQGHEKDKNEVSAPAVKNPPVLEESESEDRLPEVKVKMTGVGPLIMHPQLFSSLPQPLFLLDW